MTTTVQIQLSPPKKKIQNKPYIRIYLLFTQIFFPMLLPTNLHCPHPCEAPTTVCSVSPMLALAHSRPLPALLRKVHALLMRTTLTWSRDNFIYWKAFCTVFSNFGLNKLLFMAVCPNISGLTCFISGLTAHLNYLKWLTFPYASDTHMAGQEVLSTCNLLPEDGWKVQTRA